MKVFKLMGIAAFAMMLTLTSCGSDDPETPNEGGGSGSNTEDPITPPTNDNAALSEAEQKAYLNDIGQEFIGKFNADDFNEFADIVNFLERDNAEDDNAGVVEDWFDACLEACEGQTDEMMFVASNFYGQFERQNRKWVQTGRDKYLQFTFKDEAANQCVIKLTASEDGTWVHHEIFDTECWEYDYDNYDYIEWVEPNYIKIPKEIVLTFTQGSKTLVSAEVTTAVSQSGDDFDLSKDKIDVVAKVTIDNYVINVSRALYDAGTEASAASTISVNGETILACSATASGKVYNDRLEYSDGTVSVSLDILGKVQVRGTVKNLNSFIDALDDADYNYDNEADFKASIDLCNSLMDIKLYFDGSKNHSATLKFEPYVDQYYNEYWDFDVVLTFPDGTAYSTLETYFNENYFRVVTNQFENLLRDFENLID